MSGLLPLFSQHICQHNVPSVGSLQLDRGSTCSGENKQVMDEDALSYNSASALSHVLLQFQYSKTNSVLMVKENFNSISAKVKNASHYLQ